MRVAISTIQSMNFGNRLQNYALQMALAKLSCQAESILKDKRTFKETVVAIIRGVIISDTITRFRAFDRKHINYSRYSVTPEFVSSGITRRYDKFIIGSDQVWNPFFPFNSSMDYLPFIESSKKIAYAASFGVRSLGGKEGKIADLLSDIPYISMREKAGADLVKTLTGRSVPVVLDPTLLLSADEWLKVADKPLRFDSDRPYIFKYVLGNDINNTAIQKIANNLGYRVVDVRDPLLKAGPAEFIWLVANSSGVCTDSFHASVFSLLFHKPLNIFMRVDNEVDMSSRFDTLCSLFDIEDCRVDTEDANFGDIDWENFESRLAKLKKFSFDWLKNALFGVGARDC